MSAFDKAFRNLTRSVATLRRGTVTDALFFDPAAYRSDNADVAESVEAGQLKSFYDHYVRYGRWEGRPFTLRRWGMSSEAASRLFASAAALEGRLDTLACKLTRGELAHELRSNGGSRLSKPLGPWKPLPHNGPWRAPVPRSAKRGGYFMLKARLTPVRALLECRVLDARGAPCGDAAAFYCKPMHDAQRMLRIEAGGETIEIDVLDACMAAQPLRLRLRAVSDGDVEPRMIRRLVHHHGRFRGQSPNQVRSSLVQDAAACGRPLRNLMWEAYESTFPAPRMHGSYRDWIKNVETPLREALDRKSAEIMAGMASLPLISVILPTNDPSEAHLRACLESLDRQSYPHWELCVVDDASRAPHVRAMLRDVATRDPRIRVAHRDWKGHVCRARNDAIAMARGPFVALLNQDDLLARHALLQIAHSIDAQPHAHLLYSDEDQIAVEGGRCEPHFKPAFDPDLLLGQHYLGRLLVARTARVRAVGGFRPNYEGAEDHDLALRLIEGLSAHEVIHIPQVLYHCRRRAADGPSDAGLAAVRDALRRNGAACDAQPTDDPRCYRITRALPEPAPFVSIIVPTRESVDHLWPMIDGLFERTHYPRLELIIVSSAAYHEPPKDRRVRALRGDRSFNFSLLANMGVREARGDILALVADDVEVVEANWLARLVSEAARTQIGCVGAKLTFPNQTMQHASRIRGFAGLPDLIMSANDPGYRGRSRVTHAVGAVNADCLVVKRGVHQWVGGFDEELAIAFHDVDFCLRIRDAGYRNLLVPSSVLSRASRALELNADERQRLSRDIDIAKARWPRFIDV